MEEHELPVWPSCVKYTCIRFLGEGSTGTAYLAESPDGKQVVVKAGYYNTGGRLDNEYEACCKLFDLGLPVPKPIELVRYRIARFFIREYIPGQRLKAKVGFRDKMELEWHLSMRKSLTEIMDKLDQCGWIHGDFSARNVICGPKGPVLIDLEAAKPIGQAKKREIYEEMEERHWLLSSLRTK